MAKLTSKVLDTVVNLTIHLLFLALYNLAKLLTVKAVWDMLLGQQLGEMPVSAATTLVLISAVLTHTVIDSGKLLTFYITGVFKLVVVLSFSLLVSLFV